MSSSQEREIDKRDGIEFRWDGSFLDEIIAKDIASLHFEAMGVAQFWMKITTRAGEEWHINFGAKNTQAKGYSFAEHDE
jgi:hypothetical protein